MLHEPARARADQAVREPGTPLAPEVRKPLERSFGRDLGGVHVHTDATAARSAKALGTDAFTVGSDIAFGTGRFRPHDTEGQRLLSHEITHVVQQSRGWSNGNACVGTSERVTTGRNDPVEREAVETAAAVAAGQTAPPLAATPVGIARDEPTIEDFDEEPPTSATSATAPGAGAGPEELGEVAPPLFTRALSKTDPSIVFVPITATREVIARELGVTTSAFVPVGPAEALPPSEDVQGIRFPDPSAIPAPLMTEMRTRFDAQLLPDVQKTMDDLLAETGGWSATRYVLRWSQYAEYRDASGNSYFDRFLDALDARKVVTTRDWLVTESKTTRTGLEELLHQTEGDVYKAVLRARSRSRKRAEAGDMAYSADAPLPLGHVVGRWISGRDAATMSVQVATVLVSDVADRDEAEIRLRNAMFVGSRVLIRSSLGRWYGYGVFLGPSLGDILPPVVGNPEEQGEFYWYYPSTLYVGLGEVDPTGPAGDKHATDALQRNLLSQALQSGDNRAIISLDLSALRLATLDQRIQIFQMIVGIGFGAVEALGYSVPLAVQALSRTVLSMPPEEFQDFARRLDRAGLTAKLLATKDSRLAPLGAAFTYQTMAGTRLGEGSFQDPVELVQGTTNIGSGLNYYLANVQPPTTPDGSTTVSFEHGHSSTGWGDKPAWSSRSRETTRTMNPMELVSIETIGPSGTHRRIASAFEAAMTQGDPQSQVERESFMDFLNVIMLFQAGAGIMRMGQLGLRAMATGSLRAAMRLMAEELATQGGARAARSIVDYALFSASRYVAEHQEELEKTPEGRAFMSLVTAATAILVVRDVGTLVESGAIERLVAAGRGALLKIGESAQFAVRRTMQNFRAARLAWDTLKAEGKVLVTNVGGITIRRPTSAAALGSAFRMSQAQVAGEELIAALGTGSVADRVGKTMGQLERAAGGLARKAGAAERTEAEIGAANAYRDVARHLTKLPAGQRATFLDALEKLLATKGRTVVELAGFLQAAVGKVYGAQAVAYLEAVQWLSTSGISKAGFARMAENAAGKSPANLIWLKTTHLTPDDLDFLARDPHTPWKSYFEAATMPGDVKKLKIAMRYLRGHATEMLAGEEAMAERLVPGFKVRARQVTAGESEIDFELISTDRLGRRRGMEVKGWTRGTWKRSLDAYRRDPTARSLADPMDVAGSRQIRKMLKQLDDAAEITTRGERPVLAVTKDVSKADKDTLEALVGSRAEVVYLPEDKITAMSGRLRKGLGIQ